MSGELLELVAYIELLAKVHELKAVEGSEGTIVDGGRKIELEKLRIVLRAQGHEVTEARCGSGAAGSGGGQPGPQPLPLTV